MVETERAYAFVAGRVRAEWVEKAAGDLVRRTHFDAHWDARRAEPMVFEQVAAYGLTLIARRRVRFAPVSREGAREVFLRSGLVENGYECAHRFMERNARELARLRTVEHKLRSPGAVVSDDAVLAFYDARIPSHVVDGRTFEDWFSGLGEEEARGLELRREDIAPGVQLADETEFPDTLQIDDQSFPLAYRFAPGEDDDGLTVTIRYDVLVDLDPGRFEWLVPGLLEDKVLALLRALPKSLRRAAMPLAGLAREFVAGTRAGDGSLHEALARFLDRTRDVSVPRDAWLPARLRRVLAAHLLMRFEVIDREGAVLGQGRRLDEIERRLVAPHGPPKDATPVRGERGHRTWKFGAVPVEAEDRASDRSGVVFPALRDIGSGVIVEHFQARSAAERSHHGGLVRLFSLAMRREARECLRVLPGVDELCLLYAMIAPPPDWVDPPHRSAARIEPGTSAEAHRDLVDRTVARTFVAPADTIRERSRFEAALAAGRGDFSVGLAAVVERRRSRSCGRPGKCAGSSTIRICTRRRPRWPTPGVSLTDSCTMDSSPPRRMMHSRRSRGIWMRCGCAWRSSAAEERTTHVGSPRFCPCSSGLNQRRATAGSEAGAMPNSRATGGCWKSIGYRFLLRNSGRRSACRGRSSTNSGRACRRSESIGSPAPAGGAISHDRRAPRPGNRGK